MSHLNQRALFLKHVAQTSDTPFSGVDMVVEKAEGVWLHTREGRKYLDLISGISVSNVGHCHPEVVAAIEQQSRRYMHLIVYGEFNQTPQVLYAQALSKLLPASLHSVYFTTGGSEATEGAMKLAKRATGRTRILSFKNAYHGSTQGALSLMGDEYFKQAFRPLLPGTEQLPFGDTAALERITDDVAAVIIEPIQGEAGVRWADKTYYETLRKICDERGILLIFDEIQSGFGRTGTMFYFEQIGVVPDILLVAKGMGGGLPIGAFIASSALMNHLTVNPVLGHINTFGGNAVCVAAAMAVLNIISREALAQRAKGIEAIIKAELKHPLIKEIRIKGCLGAVDFGDEALNFKIIRACIDQGLITDWFLFCTTAMRISPPLTISDADLREGIVLIKKTLDRFIQYPPKR